MKHRYLTSIIKGLCFDSHKMAFVSGPRQCGKTTFAKALLHNRGAGSYFNWDETNFRRLWIKNPSQIVPKMKKYTPLVILDEIHKAKLWKRTLKGVYDTQESPVDILVTGSARLNVYKKGSDSLFGRYFNFRLHPFTLREIDKISQIATEHFIDKLFSRSQKLSNSNITQFDTLFKFGGFPEPLFAESEKLARLWKRSRIDKVIREDLRDLSRIPELSQIEMLVALLPERVGSLFSIVSLREYLEVSFPTVKRWINYLKELYYLFEIKPYTKSISRSLRKGGKIYLWDYSEVTQEAARFENLIACHLLKICHYWTDSGEGQFDLFYLRDKEKHEIDFLVTKDKIPWLPIEVKLNDTSPSPHWRKFLKQLNLTKSIQIVKAHGVWKMHSLDGSNILIASASEVLSYFI
ncbi:MAG: ATP-binding protein [bacterium]